VVLLVLQIEMGGCCATAAAGRNSIGGTAIEFKSKWGAAAQPLLLLQIEMGGCCTTAAAAQSTIGGTAIEFKSKWGLLRNCCCCSI
jgi:hypothetical protein